MKIDLTDTLIEALRDAHESDDLGRRRVEKIAEIGDQDIEIGADISSMTAFVGGPEDDEFETVETLGIGAISFRPTPDFCIRPGHTAFRSEAVGRIITRLPFDDLKSVLDLVESKYELIEVCADWSDEEDWMVGDYELEADLYYFYPGELQAFLDDLPSVT